VLAFLFHAIDVKTAPSLLWFATIQDIEGKRDLADLAMDQYRIGVVDLTTLIYAQ